MLFEKGASFSCFSAIRIASPSETGRRQTATDYLDVDFTFRVWSELVGVFHPLPSHIHVATLKWQLDCHIS